VSHSPTAETNSIGDPYRQGWEALFEMLYTGGSFSGRERNCCFLNRGELPFADISAVAGFDFADDGRALGLVDWDHDGALDVWSVNRSAPRARFLHNVVPSNNRFLAILLEGSTCNRDAIGARVELYLASDEQPRWIQTVRAGEGYLAQSTKWLHFGLGTSKDPMRVIVRWPGGEAEEFLELQPNSRVRLVQGSGALDSMEPRAEIELKPSRLETPQESEAARIVLAGRVPLAALDYQEFEGPRRNIPLGDRPLIINLWATWCTPCLKELKEWNAAEKRIRESGLNVLALSVDESDKHQAAQTLLRDQFQWQFDSGLATPELVNALNMVLRGLLDNKRPMPVPTTFLIDGRGRLAAIYKGAADLEQLLEDASHLDLSTDEIFLSALPFPGRWIERPTAGPLTQLAIADQLIKAGDIDEGQFYLSSLVDSTGISTLPEDAEARAALANPQFNLGIRFAVAGRQEEAIAALYRALDLRPDFPEAHFNLALALQEQNNLTQAIHHFQQAVRLKPEFAEAHYNLGHALFASKKHQQAISHYRLAIEILPKYSKAHFGLGRALLVSGQLPESIEQLKQAVSLAPDFVEAQYQLGNALMINGQAELAIDSYRHAIALNPDHPQMRYNLGVALVGQGAAREACREFREAIRIDPSYIAASNGLARSLATLPDPSAEEANEALAVAKEAAESSDNKNVAILDTLAAAFAAVDDFQQAIVTVESAIQLAEGADEKTISQLRNRLESYRRGERLTTSR